MVSEHSAEPTDMKEEVMGRDRALPSDRATQASPQAPAGLGHSVSIPSASAIGFTGTQEGCQSNQLAVLRHWLTKLSLLDFEWMRNGDCVGADAQAAAIWRDDLAMRLFIHPPVVRSKRAYLRHDDKTVPLPYLERNEDIVNASTLLVATPAEMSEQRRGGTWYTIRYANRRSKPHLIIFPDGSYVGRNGFAQAIEARRVETQGGSVHESAVAKPCAQSPRP